MYKHFVVTRLGLALYSERLLAKMTELFEIVTLPSLVRQTSQEFNWLVIIDADMPASARRRIEALLRPYAHFHLVAIDVRQLTHVRQGCFDWVWDRCQDLILENGLIDDTSQYIVTSVIDADDAWHRDVVRTVNNFMADRLSHASVGEEGRGTWLRHTAGIAATFRHGYKWFIESDAWELSDFPFMSMSVFVAARFSSGISACSSRHLGWSAYCRVLAFETLEIGQDAPMWLYVRHGLTTQPWDASLLAAIDASTSGERCQTFGIDLDRLRSWRESRTSEKRHSTAFAGRNVSDQYDRIFKIAALNRQIGALKRRRDNPVTGDGKSAGEIIVEREAQRMDLIKALHASGGMGE